MNDSVTLDVFGVMVEALRPNYIDTTMDHLDPAAKARVKRTRAFHALAKALRDAGGPELKLSVFEVTDNEFFLALEKAGVAWDADSRGNVFTFYWEQADTA